MNRDENFGYPRLYEHTTRDFEFPCKLNLEPCKKKNKDTENDRSNRSIGKLIEFCRRLAKLVKTRVNVGILIDVVVACKYLHCTQRR